MKNNKKQTTETCFFRHKIRTSFMVLLLICCVLGTTACIGKTVETSTEVTSTEVVEELTIEQIYAAAVKDSITVEDDETFPLVSITEDSDMVTWKDGKIRLMNVNSHPEYYIEGTSYPVPAGVWTFTDKEFFKWYSENKEGVTDWTMRLKQLLGLYYPKEYTHVTTIWVSPEDVRRPAHSIDITNDTMPSALPKDVDPEYKTWFDENIIWSYFDSAYPWTRMGYTYDYATDCDEYGLSEFWIKPDSNITVESTETIDEFITKLEQAGV